MLDDQTFDRVRRISSVFQNISTNHTPKRLTYSLTKQHNNCNTYHKLSVIEGKRKRIPPSRNRCLARNANSPETSKKNEHLSTRLTIYMYLRLEHCCYHHSKVTSQQQSSSIYRWLPSCCCCKPSSVVPTRGVSAQGRCQRR